MKTHRYPSTSVFLRRSRAPRRASTSGPVLGLFLAMAACLPMFAPRALAQTKDANGDGIVRMAAFGNSLTGSIRLDALQQLAAEQGHSFEYQLTQTAGAPLNFLWENMTEKSKAMLDQGGWDVINFQPFLRNIESNLAAIQEMVDYALPNSPNLAINIYAQYVKSDSGDYQALWRQDVSQYVTTGQSAEHNVRPMRTRGYYEELARRVQELYPDREVFLTPVGHAFALLDEQVKAGELPGVDDVYTLWADDTHTGHTANYLVGLVYYATLFGESPVGFEVGPYQGEADNQRTPIIPVELALLFQNLAWAATATHPLSGVSAPGTPPAIATPILYPNPVAGKAYRNELDPVFGTRPYTWSLAAGGLPDGVTFSADGVLEGQPSQTGDFPLTFELRDAGGRSAQKELTLTVETDSVPSITVDPIDLGTVAAGEFIRRQLSAEGGNGRLKWAFQEQNRLVEELKGLRLTSDGLLVGATGIQGPLELPVVVRDSDQSNPDQDSATVVLTVTQPGPEVWMVPSVEAGDFADIWELRNESKNAPEPFDWEARYVEQFLQVPGFPVDRRISGESFDNEVRVHVLREGSSLYIGVFVLDDAIVVNRENPPAGDSVEISQDILNNRQKVYNADDRRVVATADGQVSGQLGRVHGGVVIPIEGGYFVGTREPTHSLKRGLEPGIVMGLDIAVHDKDSADGPVSTVLWHGDVIDEEDTSTFGTIILAEDGDNGNPANTGSHITASR